ncbi:hypothetical protein HOI18_04020 [Candidatus Uhrbacteria bacterium]|nr:hypothetical protein [Candidatus Uhrbacteria bacterium]
MKKSVFVLVAVVVIVAALIIALTDGSGSIDDAVLTPNFQDSTDDGLTQATCESADGVWNACGSACRQDPGAICIEICMEYCECQSDDQCPDDLSCSDYVEDVGVCL